MRSKLSCRSPNHPNGFLAKRRSVSDWEHGLLKKPQTIFFLGWSFACSAFAGSPVQYFRKKKLRKWRSKVENCSTTSVKSNGLGGRIHGSKMYSANDKSVRPL